MEKRSSSSLASSMSLESMSASIAFLWSTTVKPFESESGWQFSIAEGAYDKSSDYCILLRLFSISLSYPWSSLCSAISLNFFSLGNAPMPLLKVLCVSIVRLDFLVAVLMGIDLNDILSSKLEAPDIILEWSYSFLNGSNPNFDFYADGWKSSSIIGSIGATFLKDSFIYSILLTSSLV